MVVSLSENPFGLVTISRSGRDFFAAAMVPGSGHARVILRALF
ncbi:hypothetical protein [Ancylobacter pratisalsi]|nr:hypothetical protein [Ancylobacter pratisalsi]